MFGACDKGNWHERRGPRLAGKILLGITIAVAFALVFGIFVMLLWNWLMPQVFNLNRITYGEAFGLLLLARLLFGGFGRHGRHGGRFAARHGFGPPWHGRWCSKGDAANGIEDWRHYDAWWEAEGRESYRKYSEGQKK